MGPESASVERKETSRPAAEVIDLVAVRIRKLLDALRESTLILGEVEVNGERVKFDPDRDPDLLKIAEVQHYVKGLEGELEKAGDQTGREAEVRCNALGIALGHAKALENILKFRADAETTGRETNSFELEKVVREAETLLAA